ncbi:MAG: hypothetical protein PVI23_06235 [Maricaulaceae bacterium]|jgi:hypothetical protein
MRAVWAIGQTVYSVIAVGAAAWLMIAVLATPTILQIPGATSSIATMAFVISLMAAPASLIVSAAIGWLAYARSGVRLVLAGFGLVLVNGLLLVAAFGAVQVFCDGQFACSA